MGAHEELYLVLNRYNNVVGTTTISQVSKETGLSPTTIRRLISRNKHFYNDCMLIEYEDEKEIFSNRVLFYTNSKGDKYYIYKDCSVKKVSKNGDSKPITTFKHRNAWEVKVEANKAVNVARVAAKHFIKPDLNQSHCVFVKGPFKLKNILIMDARKVRSINGYKSSADGKRKRKRVGLYEDNKPIKKWDSCYKAAKDLFVSHQTVRDICDRKVKNRLYDLRYL